MQENKTKEKGMGKGVLCCGVLCCVGEEKGERKKNGVFAGVSMCVCTCICLGNLFMCDDGKSEKKGEGGMLALYLDGIYREGKG